MTSPQDASHVCAAYAQEAATELASLYALDALLAEEKEAFEKHVASCASCRDELRDFLEVTGAVGHVTAEEEDARPSDSVRDNLLFRIGYTDTTQAPVSETEPEVQVWKDWQAPSEDRAAEDGSSAAEGLTVVRAGEENWQPTGVDGITAKRLSVDAETGFVTMLARMAPGTSYPSHRHAGIEECFVLEGDLQVAGETLNAGDYQRADSSSIHGVQATTGGCTLLLRSSQHDELL
jgi:anti-sigma factor ChrR (cupin superfamily)